MILIHKLKNLVSKILDRYLVPIGIILALILIFFVYEPKTLQKMLYYFGVSYYTSYLIINIVVYTLCVIMGIFFFSLFLSSVFSYYNKRITQLKAEELLLSDNRRPILILRAFKRDNTKVFPIKYDGETHINFESLIVSRLKDFGPIISTGNPNESIQPLGASRLYMDETWENKVQTLIQESVLIVLIADYSPGILWEIETVLNGYKEKTIIIPPLHSSWINNILSILESIHVAYISIFIAQPILFILNRYYFIKRVRRSFMYYKNWDNLIVKKYKDFVPSINDKIAAITFSDDTYELFISERPSNASQINAILSAINKKCAELCKDETCSQKILDLAKSVLEMHEYVDIDSFGFWQKLKFVIKKQKRNK